MRWRLYAICINILELYIKSTDHFVTLSWAPKSPVNSVQLVHGPTMGKSCSHKWFQILIECCQTILVMSMNHFFNQMGNFTKILLRNYAKKDWKKFAWKKCHFFVKLILIFIHILVNFSKSIWSICYYYTISESYDHGCLNAL